MAKSRTSKVLALSSGQALTTVVGIVSAVVLSRVLTKYDYATYRQTLLAYAFAAPLLTLALPQALYYFMPGEEKRKRGLLVDNLILLAAMGMIFSAFLLLGGNRLLAWRFSNPELEYTLKIFAPYPLFMLPMGAIGACLLVQERVTLLTVYNVISRLLIVGAIIVSCLIWKNPVAPLVSNVVTAVLVCLVAIFLMFSVIPRDSWHPDLASMKAMLKYSIPLGLAGMVGTISLQLDKMIVSSMCSPEDFAVYANGAMEIPLVGIITGSIAAVIIADMARLYKEDSKIHAINLFNKAAVKSASLLIPIMFLCFIFAKPFILLLFSNKYIDSIIPFRLYLLLIPARVVYFGMAVQAAGKSKVVMYGAILNLILNGFLSIIFVNFIGYNGAVISTILCVYALNFGFLSYYISKYYEISFANVFPLREISKIILICFVATIPTLPYIFVDAVGQNRIMVLSSALSFCILCLIILCKLQYITNPVLYIWKKWGNRNY